MPVHEFSSNGLSVNPSLTDRGVLGRVDHKGESSADANSLTRRALRAGQGLGKGNGNERQVKPGRKQRKEVGRVEKAPLRGGSWSHKRGASEKMCV